MMLLPWLSGHAVQQSGRTACTLLTTLSSTQLALTVRFSSCQQPARFKNIKKETRDQRNTQQMCTLCARKGQGGARTCKCKRARYTAAVRTATNHQQSSVSSLPAHSPALLVLYHVPSSRHARFPTYSYLKNKIGVNHLYTGFKTCFAASTKGAGGGTKGAGSKTYFKSRFCDILKNKNKINKAGGGC